MDIVDRDVITELAQRQEWPSISLYLPTEDVASLNQQDRIRLKNLLKDAVGRLVDSGMRAPDAEKVCAPLREALEDHTFWRESSHGIAAFITPDKTRIYRLDITMPEQLMVGDRFYVRPLVSAYHGQQRYYALALDKGITRLLRCDRTSFEELSLGDTPTSFADSMKYEEAQPQMSHSTYAAGRLHSRGDGEGSVYAGHGGEKDVATDQMIRFARDIERGVSAVLGTDDAPLILMGIERLIVAYRELNTYPHIVAEQVSGSSEHLSGREIHEQTRDAMGSYFQSKIDADLEKLAELEGQALVSHDPAEIVAAAASGRVDTLFFDDRMGPFGQIDRETFEVTQVCESTPRFLRESSDPQDGPTDGECGWDLVDLAVAETMLHSGRILAFNGEDTPVQGVAAVFRY